MTKKMKVYQAEIDAGIAEVIKAEASVAYCTLAKAGDRAIARVTDPEAEAKFREYLTEKKLIAENQNQLDLFYLESVLVSTGWNKNDDVFLPAATWAARTTPEDKQFNFMHDENDIIGHITGSYVLDKSGNRLEAAENAEAPPEFDIITQAVLYNSWNDPENKQRMDRIIAEIQEGKWYVSMECLFAGFDYALISPNGEAKLLERNEASAFLSKHLRSYGGTGKYEDYKIGRALKNISFSGKGLVSQPANPRSVILSSKSVAAFNADENDITKTLPIGENTMADTNVLEKQVEQLQAELTAAKAEHKAAQAKIEEAKEKEIAEKIKAFENTVTQKDEAVAALEEKVKSGLARVAELEDALKASQKELSDAQAAVSDMKKKEQTMCRKAALAAAGLDEAKIEETLAGLGELSDTAFDAVVAAFKGFDKKKDDKKDDKSDAGDKTAAKDALDSTQSTEASLVTQDGDDDKEVEAARAAMSKWMGSTLSNQPTDNK